MTVDIDDDSFKKPGAVPFKWEIIPGVPKKQQQQHQQQPLLLPKLRLKENHRKQPQTQPPSPPPLTSPSTSFIHRRSSSPSPLHQQPRSSSPAVQPQQQKLKLKPPPAVVAKSYPLPPPSEPRSHSFRSNPRSRSERWRFDQSNRLRPECVSPGCFLGPWFRKKEKSKKRVPVPRPESEPDYSSELETLARWSVSSRKSLSPFRSPLSSYSSSSYFSSPRPGGDSDWAGFGLF